MPDSADIQSFSTIQFFKLFQAALKRIDTPPLDMHHLSIQKDAYARLADREESEFYLESPDVFATLENGKKETDTDLRFIVEFASGCLMMGVEGLFSGAYDLRDETLFHGEADAVKQLINTLKMLSNGQIAVGLTLFGGEVCASEMIVTGRSAPRNIVIATMPAFNRASKRASPEDLGHLVLKNHYPLDAVALSEDSLLYDDIVGDMITAYGRPGDEALDGPLSYKEFKGRIEGRIQANIGQKPGQSNLAYLFKSWEFWVIGALMGSIPVCLRLLGYLPEFLVENPSLLAVPFTILAAFLTPYAKEWRLGRKHAIKGE